MNQGDIESIMRGMTPILRDTISAAVQPLIHRLVALESREPPQGEPGEPGKDGNDGQDGAPGDKGEPGESGTDGKDGANAYAGEAKGLFDPENTYRAMDVVSFNGSEWRAKHDDPGPLPGEGWMLSAQRGKRGDRGERGPAGVGKDGKDGANPIALKFDAEKMQFIMALDDGNILEADFEPVARAIRGE